MNEQLERQLVEDFPTLFEFRPGVPVNIAVGDGWEPIIRGLSEKLAVWAYRNESPVRFRQIKEKFGELRLSLEGGDEYVADLVRQAEQQSWTTCETCGRPGVLREEGWMKTRCDPCQLVWRTSRP